MEYMNNQEVFMVNKDNVKTCNWNEKESVEISLEEKLTRAIWAENPTHLKARGKEGGKD